MSSFISFIGSIFIFAWVAITFAGLDIRTFFPNDDYNSLIEDLMNHKLLLLLGGIILSILGMVTKIKKHRENNKKNNKRNQRINDLFDKSDFKNPQINSDSEYDPSLLRKDFVKEKSQDKVEQFVSGQEGHLKELAMKTEWTPLRRGGSNFKTTSLKRVSSSRLETSKSKGGLAFSAIFALVGLGIMFGMSYEILQQKGLSIDLIFPLLFGSIFAAIGIAMIVWPRPRIFDLRQGWFWVGSRSLRREQEFVNLKKSARLSDIEAIQVIAEGISGNKGGSYISWEINLVSKDGQRLNVMDHGKKESIIDDAQFLGEFLDVPVWENT